MESALQEPVIAERSCQAQPDLDRVRRGLAPGQGSAQVGLFAREPLLPDLLLRAGQVDLRLLGHRQKIVRMPLVHGRLLAAALQALQPVFAHRLQHVKARFFTRLSHLHQQTRIQQRCHCVQDRNGRPVRWPMGVHHDLGRLQCPVSHEDRELTEDLLLLVL